MPFIEHRNICGGCDLVFSARTAKESARMLQDHVHDDPCPHYADPSELELRMRVPLRGEKDAPFAYDHAEMGNVRTSTRIKGARTHAEFRLRSYEEMGGRYLNGRA